MQSESIKELATALAKAQAELKPILADSEVKVATKTGRDYTYKFAPLDKVFRETMPILAKYGLAIAQGVDFEGDTTFVETMLMHESGEWKQTRLPFKMLPNPQDTGSLITYYKRYSWQAMIGVPSSGEDDDGNAAKQADKDEQKKAQDAAFQTLKTALAEIEVLAHLRNWWKKHKPEIDKLPKAQQVELLGMGDAIKKKSQEQTTVQKPAAKEITAAKVNVLITEPLRCKTLDDLHAWWKLNDEFLDSIDDDSFNAIKSAYRDREAVLRDEPGAENPGKELF